jgi:hypothetical protein
MDGSEVPAWIAFQNATECLLAEQAYGQPTFGIVAALTVDAYAMECHLFDVPRDPQTREEIVARVKRFWEDVERGSEPEADFERDRQAIEALNPHERSGVVRDFSGHNEVPWLLAQRAELCERIKRDEARRESIETELKFLLGDAEMATGVNGWRITYKTTDFKEYTVAARSRRVLRIQEIGS